MTGTNEIDLLGQLEQASSALAERVRTLESVVSPLLERVYSIFPAYTGHSLPHSRQVMAVLSWLIPSVIANSLLPEEIFYLLGGALLHDIGMLGAVDEVGNPAAQRRIRDSHHLRSEQYVNDNYQELGLDRTEARAIGEICRAHRKIDIARDVRDVPIAGGAIIRMQLLCATVRIADELHLTADRAPQIVLDAIRASQESTQHFRKHLSITGVGPFNSSQGSIVISATVETAAQERVLQHMAKEIQEKLTEVEPIFTEHGLPWKTIRLSLTRRKVVERKVTLYLAGAEQSSGDGLAAKLNESSGDVEACLQDLVHLQYIQTDGETGHVNLVQDFRTFEYLLRLFLKTDDELEFVSSRYLEICLEEFAFDSFCRRFDAVYDQQEREERILVLQSSPTALYLVLFAEEFQQVEPTIIPRSAVLDRAILLGFLMDVFRFPQIARIKGIEIAVRAIEDRVGQDSQTLLRLLKALGPDVGRDPQDVLSSLVLSPEVQDADLRDGSNLQVGVSHPQIALQRGLTFPHLLKAAMISGEPLALVGHRVQLSSKDPEFPKAALSSPDHVVIIPYPRSLPPQRGTFFCRVEIDRVKKRLTFFADTDQSANYSKYPISIQMTIPLDGKNAVFRPTAYLTLLDVQQSLEINEMYNWIKSGNFHRFRIEPDRQASHPSDLMSFEALGSDLKDKTIEPFLDESRCQILQHLADLQNRLSERIPCPIRLTVQQETAITELAEKLDDMSETQARNELVRIAKMSEEDVTTVRVSTYFPGGEIESDEFLGPFPRVVPTITSKQDEANRQLHTILQSGQGVVRITEGYALDLDTLRRTIIEGYTGVGEWGFLPKPDETEEAAQTFCQVTIQPIQDRMWYREQIIHYQIRSTSIINSIHSDARQLLKQARVQEAVDRLTEAARRFPKEPTILGHLGWAYYEAGNLDAAYKHSLEAVTDSEGERWSMRLDFVHYNLGLYSLLRGRIDESMSWYEKGVRGGAGPALDESIEDLESILTPEVPEALYAMAFLYEHKGDLSNAAELYNRFLDSDSHPEEYEELAREALVRLGQKNEHGESAF